MLIVEPDVKQVVLFKDESNGGSSFKNQKKESSSSIRYSTANKNSYHSDEEEMKEEENKEQDPNYKFFETNPNIMEVHINSPTDEDKIRIVENYQVKSIK